MHRSYRNRRSLLLATLVGCAGAPVSGPRNALVFDDAFVQAACGECQFGLEGEGCDLAVRLGDRAWFVDGTAIDDHGDAHAADGFCNAVRRARVSGRVVDGRLVVTSFALVD